MGKLGDSAHRLISFVMPGRYRKSYDLCRTSIITSKTSHPSAVTGNDMSSLGTNYANFDSFGYLPFINPYTYTKASSFDGTAFMKKTDGSTLSFPNDETADQTCLNCEKLSPTYDGNSYSGVFEIRAYGRSCYASSSPLYCDFVGLDFGPSFYGSQVMWVVNTKEYFQDSSSGHEEGMMSIPTSGTRKFKMTSEKEFIMFTGNALSSHSKTGHSFAPQVTHSRYISFSMLNYLWDMRSDSTASHSGTSTLVDLTSVDVAKAINWDTITDTTATAVTGEPASNKDTTITPELNNHGNAMTLGAISPTKQPAGYSKVRQVKTPFDITKLADLRWSAAAND